MIDYENKYVLVTGGTGMIGRSLINILREKKAKITVVSLDKNVNLPRGVAYINLDLTQMHNCLLSCDGMDYVFHLAGIKGSPKMCKEQPASFFVPTILFNTNMLEAARRKNVKRFLYTSSVGVYSPAELLSEDNVWKTFPSENDKFAGWAKRMGELQIEAYKIQYGINNIRIVRPANVYGPFDNFDPANSMVIPALIKRIDDGENPLKVWGDGSQIRDFIYTDDCAEGMLKVFESDETRPVNLASGTGISIKEIVELIIKYSDKKPKVEWDTSKPSGDRIRLLEVERAKNIGFKISTSIEEGIKKTIEWYKINKERTSGRYNVFTGGDDESKERNNR